MFPEKTLDWMIEKVESCGYLTILSKLKEIKILNSDDKKNRWFGYYQRLGEDIGFWNLNDIMESVRNEML